MNCASRRFLDANADVRNENCFKTVNEKYTRKSPLTKLTSEGVNFRYAFIIAFENSICQDYVSEKGYNALFYVNA